MTLRKQESSFLSLQLVGVMFWWLLFKGFWGGSYLAAAPVPPSVTLAPLHLSVGKTLQVTVTLIQKGRPVATPTLISRSFQSLTPPVRSSKLIVRKGEVKKQLDFIYRLRAIRVGKALVSVKVGSRLLGPYSVQISAEKETESEQGLTLLAENVVSKKNFFIHEPFVVETKLYFDRDFTGIKLVRAFEYENLRLQKLVNKGSSVGRAKRNGKSYGTYVFLRHLAYPLAVGRALLSKGSLEVEVSSTPGGVPVVMEVAIPPLTLTVKQYPKEGRPLSFKDNFGTFTLSAQLPEPPLRVKQVSKISLVVTGVGNFQALVFPQLKLQPAEPGVLLSGQQEDNFSPQQGSFAGKAIRSFYLLPSKIETLSWAPLRFSFYSPTKKGYVTQRLMLPDLPVLQNLSQQGHRETAPKKPPVKPKLLAVSPMNSSVSLLTSTSTNLKAALESYSVPAAFAVHGVGIFLMSLFFWWNKTAPPRSKNQLKKIPQNIKERLRSWEKKPPQLEKREELLKLLELLHWVNDNYLVQHKQPRKNNPSTTWEDKEKTALAITLKPPVQKQLEQLEKWLYSPPQIREHCSSLEAKELFQQSSSLIKKILSWHEENKKH